MSKTVSRHRMYARLIKAIRTKETASAFAKDCGVSDSFISGILSGRKQPSEKVLAKLGLRAVVSRSVVYWEVE